MAGYRLPCTTEPVVQPDVRPLPGADHDGLLARPPLERGHRLRRCDLNVFRKEIAFGRIVVNQNGSHIYTEKLSKTDDVRVVPMPYEVMTALLAHIEKYCPDAGPEDFLFLNHKGENPARSGFCRNTLRKAANRAGLADRRITWLTLRHTAASLMFDAGLNIFDVQRRLGHASPTMTMEVYTHLMRERFEEGRELMNRYIAGPDARHDMEAIEGH